MQWLYPKLLHIHIQNVQKRVHILNIPSLLTIQDFILYKFRQNLQVRGNRRTLLRALKLYIGAWVWKESHKKYRNWRWNFNKPEKFWRGKLCKLKSCFYWGTSYKVTNFIIPNKMVCWDLNFFIDYLIGLVFYLLGNQD